MTTSATLGIPYISSSQSQPEITHNTALDMLQSIIAGGAIEIGATAEPGSPSEGDIYVLGGSPTGTNWSGNGNKIAGFFNSQWVFVPGVDSDGTSIAMGADQEGIRIWSKADNDFAVWSNSVGSPNDYTWRFLGTGQNSLLGLSKNYWKNASNDSNSTSCTLNTDTKLPIVDDGPDSADSGNLETGKVEFDASFDGSTGGFIVDQLNSSTMLTIRISIVNLGSSTTASVRVFLIPDKTSPGDGITVNTPYITLNSGVEASPVISFFHGGTIEAVQVAINPTTTESFMLNGVLIEARETQ